MKYWNKERLRRIRSRRERAEQRAFERRVEEQALKRTYTKGEARKNARLMLEVLGSSIHRSMLERLRTNGAMSVTHLVEPFRIKLPDAMRHVHILERAGLITTEKRGRVRHCIYRNAAFCELSVWLASRNPCDVD